MTLYIDPVIGWRAWWLRGNQLHSVHHPTIWTPGEFVVAECRDGCCAPDEDHTCGIHACATFEQLRLIYLHGMPEVYGLVALWGKVVVGERGWRAQYAYPSRLHTTNPAIVGQLTEYGVAVIVDTKEGERD